MSRIQRAITFCDQFNVPSVELQARGAFAPILNVDTPLFVDPLLLERSAHPEMVEGFEAWKHRFSTLVKLLENSSAIDDSPWRAADKLFKFKEFSGTCLGYGSGIAGSGIGAGLRRRLLVTAKEIVELGVKDPELFALLPLIEEDIGPDRISDMTTRIIGRQLEAFTHRVLDGFGVPMEDILIDGDVYRLPINDTWRHQGRMPVVLVPTDVLRELPIASDWDDISRVANENNHYRQRINAALGDLWTIRSRQKKSRMRAVMLADESAFQGVLKTVLAAKRDHYDSDADPAGLTKWPEFGRAVVSDFPLYIHQPTSHDADSLRSVVETIVGKFREIIEQNGGWKLLWVKSTPRHERYSQLLFFTVAASYCAANNIDISPEVDAGGGPVDFKFSTGYSPRLLVELKLSTNQKLPQGYSRQLEAYKKAEKTNEGIYLLIDLGSGSDRIERVLEMEADARSTKKKHSTVEVVDASRKKSASKL